MAEIPSYSPGWSATYSGAGFAQMQFRVQALAPADFDAWVAATRAAPTTLDFAEYKKLAAPSTLKAPMYYAAVAPDLFEDIVMQFMYQYSPTHAH